MSKPAEMRGLKALVMQDDAWKGFSVITITLLGLVTIAFILLGVVLPHYQAAIDFLGVAQWQNAGAGIGLVVGAPVAFAGSMVAIVLAQRAVDISNRQHDLDALSQVAPLVDRVEAYYWDWTQKVERLLDILYKLAGDIQVLSIQMRAATDDVSAETAAQHIEKKFLHKYGADLSAAVGDLKAHVRESNRHPVLHDVLAQQWQEMIAANQCCVKNVLDAFNSRYRAHRSEDEKEAIDDSSRIGDYLDDFDGSGIGRAVRAVINREWQPFGFGMPYDRLSRAPSEAEMPAFIHLIGLILEDDTSHMYGPAALMDLIALVGHTDLVQKKIAEFVRAMDIASPRIDKFVTARLASYQPDRFFQKTTRDIHKTVLSLPATGLFVR